MHMPETVDPQHTLNELIRSLDSTGQEIARLTSRIKIDVDSLSVERRELQIQRLQANIKYNIDLLNFQHRARTETQLYLRDLEQTMSRGETEGNE